MDGTGYFDLCVDPAGERSWWSRMGQQGVGCEAEEHLQSQGHEVFSILA